VGNLENDKNSFYAWKTKGTYYNMIRADLTRMTHSWVNWKTIMGKEEIIKIFRKYFMDV
jgi:hypothetical protein